MKRFLVIAFFLCLLSCQKDNKHLSKANSYFVEYLHTNESAYLDSSYQTLRTAGYFNSKRLNPNNADLISSLLLYMRKYDELENLLKENNNLEEYQKDFTLNLTLALKTYKNDSLQAKDYILENEKMVKNKIAATPNDSILWVSYFAMRIYMVGKQQALQEVDSIKASNEKFSDSFYENILVDFIEEYPSELMFDKTKR
jgi:hypothetical protein